MGLQLKILKQEYFKAYKTQLSVDVETTFAILKNKPQSVDDFKFYFANSAVHSSNIEGNSINFDTYLKATEFNLHLKTKEIKEIEELIEAYQFAGENNLSIGNILKAHEILTQSILIKKERGKIRKVKVGVRSEGRLIYLAVEPECIKGELEKLFADTTSVVSDSIIKPFTPPNQGPLGIDTMTGVVLYGAAILFAVLILILWRRNIIHNSSSDFQSERAD